MVFAENGQNMSLAIFSDVPLCPPRAPPIPQCVAVVFPIVCPLVELVHSTTAAFSMRCSVIVGHWYPTMFTSHCSMEQINIYLI